MATIQPGTRVSMKAESRALLRYPPSGEQLVVAVHSSALRQPCNALTLAIDIAAGAIVWVGAIDEAMLDVVDGNPVSNARGLIHPCLLRGLMLWHLVTPGKLWSQQSMQQTTVYGGSRPWLVIGELASGDLLALAINDAGNQNKWYTPFIPRTALPTTNPKDSQLELAHLWSFPSTVHDAGLLSADARTSLEHALLQNYQ